MNKEDLNELKDELVEFPWKRWWVALWTANALTLMALIWTMPPYTWMVAASISFGLMEALGLLKNRDAYPPLTHVMRRYLPRWLTHTLIFGVWGAVAAFWLGFAHPEKMGALTALLGWLQDHFDDAYEVD